MLTRPVVRILDVPPRVMLSFWATIWSLGLQSASTQSLILVPLLMLWLKSNGSSNYFRSSISISGIPLWFFAIMLAVIYISTNLVQHQCTKHVEIDLHFIQGKVAIGGIHVLHVPSIVGLQQSVQEEESDLVGG